VDLYGTQQPITLLLFLMGKGTLYDRGKDLNLKVHIPNHHPAICTCRGMRRTS
jgi:hypothetical protein